MNINFSNELFDWLVSVADEADMPVKSYIVKHFQEQKQISQQGEINESNVHTSVDRSS